MTKGSERISKSEWTAMGGLSNPRLWRKMRGGTWFYYKTFDWMDSK